MQKDDWRLEYVLRVQRTNISTPLHPSILTNGEVLPYLRSMYFLCLIHACLSNRYFPCILPTLPIGLYLPPPRERVRTGGIGLALLMRGPVRFSKRALFVTRLQLRSPNKAAS